MMALDALTQPEEERSAALEGSTERVETVSRPDAASRRDAELEPASPAALEPGHYLEVQGSGERLLVRLDEGVTHIGRGLAADLRLDENSVSRRHAMVVYEDAQVRILDDRSSNGTIVNGRRVDQATLDDGDLVKLGRVTLRYLVAG
jgi:pSer/pThr/pTyr-binding forkhead associated (FHA) protein